MSMTQTIPALPVRDAPKAVEFYRDKLGFEVLHHDGGFAVMGRDEAIVHLWEAGDESWRKRESMEEPVRSGAESFIAGTASCRIMVTGVDTSAPTGTSFARTNAPSVKSPENANTAAPRPPRT